MMTDRDMVLCGEQCSVKGQSRWKTASCSAHVLLQDVFSAFFGRVLALRAGSSRQQLAQHELTSYLLFIINAFQSLEDEMVRPQVRQGHVSDMGVTSVCIWLH